MSVGYLFTWLMVMLRSIGVVVQLPVIAGQPIPVVVRLGISAGVATLLGGLVPPAAVPPGLGELTVAAVMEIIAGFALGLVVRMSFGAVEMAGRIISGEIGLMAQPGLGAPEPAHEPVAAALSALAVVLFFALGAHHGVLVAFAKTFQLAPPGGVRFDAAAASAMVNASARLIELGVRIAAPFMAMNFLVNIAFSALGRAVPKMNVFIISFSARTLFGISLLGTAGALMGRYLYVEFGELPLRLLQLLRAR